MIAQHIPGIENQWEKYGSLFRKEELPATWILLKRRDFAQKMYFICQGGSKLGRLDFNTDGTNVQVVDVQQLGEAVGKVAWIPFVAP